MVMAEAAWAAIMAVAMVAVPNTEATQFELGTYTRCATIGRLHETGEL